jgi:selenocysteine lyase/cysteine desulfurase
MTLSRRAMCGTLATLAAGAVVAPARGDVTSSDAIALPDRANFTLDHVYLNAAYTHPLGRNVCSAGEAFLRSRVTDPDRAWPEDNPRDRAVAGFASLINAAPQDIAVVPSTMEGENLIVVALDLNKTTAVVTDAYHYSLPLYGALQNRGIPVAIATPRNHRIDLSEMERLIDHSTRLVAVSAVSSDTGFTHDLKALCEIAHRKGALVYADIIQAVGAVLFDVRSTGVDFCCAGTYKWLMGDFGVGFLYVRPDRLEHLERVMVGWRQYESYTSHIYPFDPPGRVGVEYTLGSSTAARFEVSTPDWGGLAVVEASLAYLRRIGVDRIARYRAPLLERLQAELPSRGFESLTPPGSNAPLVVFAFEGAARRLGPALAAARIKVQLYKNRIRISPSVYNDMGDIDQLMRVIATVT